MFSHGVRAKPPGLFPRSPGCFATAELLADAAPAVGFTAFPKEHKHVAK